jgi:hypothetical protein
MRTLTVTFFLVTALLAPASAQNVARGVVYHDANGNGSMDTGEQGLENVAVSNGEDVVLSGENGRYTLPVGDDTILFVIKPAGYRLPLDDRKRPQFYHIHKSKGSPDLKYPGVSPTGSLPASVDFGLVEVEDSDTFEMLVFGDPQPYTEREVDFFDRDIVDELVGASGFRFGITLGDLVGDDLDLFAPYSSSVARIGIPWFNVYGNHDMNFDASKDRYADETFESVFGPTTYAFSEGRVHFIVVDNVIYPRPGGESGYIGGLTEQQLTFIENDLRHVPKDHLVVLAMHIPLFVPEWREGDAYFRMDDRARLFELLTDFPHTLSLSAHTHVQRHHFFNREDGWKGDRLHHHYNVGTTSGDWWSGTPDQEGIPPSIMRDGTPNGYAILRFDGNRYTIDYRVARADSAHTMNLWGPKVVPQREWFNADLYVNFFSGSDSTTVAYRINGRGPWKTMKRVRGGDPHVAALRYRWDTTDTLPQGKRPNNPVISTHLWKTRVPKNLPEGRHRIDVRVTDMFGRQFFETFRYQVVAR